MSDIYIKYLIIGNLDTSKLVTEYITKSFGSAEKNNVNKIFQRICKKENRTFEERNKITSKENAYYFIIYQPNLVFIAYVDESYPERLVFAMFEEIKNDNILLMNNEEMKEFNSENRQKLKVIIEKYQDKDKMDKIGEIQNDVNEVKIVVKKDIDKMVQNIEDIEKLNQKANELKEATEQYKNTSEEVRKIACWKNWKLWVILIIIILVILSGIIIYFVVE